MVTKWCLKFLTSKIIGPNKYKKSYIFFSKKSKVILITNDKNGVDGKISTKIELLKWTKS